MAFAVKTPLGTLAALLATLVVLLDPRSRLRRDGELAWLLVPAAIVTVATVGSRLNIGHRHLLPLYPFLYVLAGRLTLHIGEEEVSLDAGDSIYFDSSVPHAYRRGGGRRCAAIVVTTA